MARGSSAAGFSESDKEEWMRLESAPILRTDAFPESRAWHRPHTGTPVWVWPLLAASVLAISSAGAVFEQMMDVSPITLASWRLQLTTVLLFIGAVWQWKYDMDESDRRRTVASSKLLTASGVCLAFHFGFWVWSLEHTSLTHSLLLVCSVPVLIAAGMIMLRKPISQGEVVGTGIGVLGGLLLALGPHASDNGKVTLAGDAAALAGAIVFIGYLTAGRTLRQWMPIAVYAAPVTGIAAFILGLAAMAIEGAHPFKGGSEGLVGWITDAHYAKWIVYLSFVPGIIGHTGFNTLLRYLTPLTVSLAFQLEPLFGSLIGWMAGVVDTSPGWATWVGGCLVLGATCLVTVATARREARQEAKGQAVVQLEQVFAEPTQGSEEEQGLLAGHDPASPPDHHHQRDADSEAPDTPPPRSARPTPWRAPPADDADGDAVSRLSDLPSAGTHRADGSSPRGVVTKGHTNHNAPVFDPSFPAHSEQEVRFEGQCPTQGDAAPSQHTQHAQHAGAGVRGQQGDSAGAAFAAAQAGLESVVVSLNSDIHGHREGHGAHHRTPRHQGPNTGTHTADDLL